MTYCLSFLLFIIVAAACNSGKEEQYFTGTIAYAYTYSSDSLNNDSLSAARPAKSDFRYDLQDYQSRFFAKDTATYYYSGKLNRCLAETNRQRNYSCEDYGQQTDTVLSWKVYETEEKVMGHSCQVVELQKGGSWVKYYVATDLRIAPSTYEKHKAYNWDTYGVKAGGGLILKLEHRFKAFTMKGIATDITLGNDHNFKALEIEESVFAENCK